MVWLGSLVESWREETCVAAQAAAENRARNVPSCGLAASRLLNSARIDVGSRPSVLGCAIRMMPKKPTITADQRRMPTCSFSIGIEKIVTKIGEARPMQTAFGSG